MVLGILLQLGGTAALLALVITPSTAPPRRGPLGQLVVEYGLSARIGWTGIALGYASLCGLMAFTGEFARPTDRLVVLAILSPTTILIVWAAFNVYTRRVLLGTDGITDRRWYRRDKFVAWSSIAAVSYSVFCQWLLIDISDGSVIRIPRYLRGFLAALPDLEERLPPFVRSGVRQVPDYHRVARGKDAA